jgi:peptidoglycan hydrolase-like protein with peptidoglycan-binding domain
VCALQLEYGIVWDSEDPLCGVFGQQTRTQLQKTLKEKSSQLTTKTTTPIKAVEPVKIAPTLQQKKGWTVVRISRAYLVWESHPEIGQLQKFLKEQKMYAGEITNIYDKATLEAIYLFQLAHTILTDQSPVGIRWYLGPTTQKKLLESSQQ